MKYDLSKKPTRFAERTLADFSESLMRLLEENALESITVNELCDTCNYPRATFYNYFDDIYDLLNYCWYCMERDISTFDYREIEPGERIYDIFGRIYDYFTNWQERLEKVMKHNTINGAFASSCSRYVRKRISDLMKASRDETDYGLPFEMMAEHYGNTFQLVLEWSFLRSKSLSKEDAVNSLHVLLNGK
jgi:Transcriptional regulator